LKSGNDAIVADASLAHGHDTDEIPESVPALFRVVEVGFGIHARDNIMVVLDSGDGGESPRSQ